MKSVTQIMILLLLSYMASAQLSASDTMKPVIIKEKKSRIHNGSIQSIDSNLSRFYQNKVLQSLLILHSNVYVRNYGVGQLSTISIRGSSAAQTKVIWNGININNAMTGLTDFSVLPVSFFDQIQIEYGSQTQGASIGGAICLENKKAIFKPSHQYKLGLAYESIRNMGLIAGALTSGYHYENHVRLSMNRSENKYSFFNPDKNRRDTLKHANTREFQLLNDFHYKINGSNILSWHLWAIDQKRSIAPASFEERSVKEESNKIIRTLLHWDHQLPSTWQLSTKIGMIVEKFQYEDSLVQLSTDATLMSIPFQQRLTWSVHDHHFYIQGMANRSFLIKVDEAALSTAGFMAYYQSKRLWNRLLLKGRIQKEFSNIFDIPFAWNLTLNYRLYNSLSIYGTASSAYRVPTLNELYFKPGGNLNLKPEHAKNIEGGLLVDKKWHHHSFQLDLACYSRNVENWIIWYGSSILTPHNIQRVWSRGLEGIMNTEFILSEHHVAMNSDRYEIEIIGGERNTLAAHEQSDSKAKIKKSDVIHKKSKKMALKTGMFYAYTLSTTEESAIKNDYSIGKQIPYVPRYQLKANVGLSVNAFEISYIHTYTGYRFVTTDESQFLKPYFTGNILASYSTKLNKYTLQYNLQCNNIFNAHYQSIVGRVMPERNFSLGLLLK